MADIIKLILLPFDKIKKMWFIRIIGSLTAIGLIGPKIGVNIIDFNELLFGIPWSIILGIGILWIVIWALFPGKAM